MTIGVERGEEAKEITPPSVGRFWLSVLSLGIPIGGLLISTTASHLIGYLSVLCITFPIGLSFKGRAMEAEALGRTDLAFLGLRRTTNWIFLVASILAVVSAGFFAVGLS